MIRIRPTAITEPPDYWHTMGGVHDQARCLNCDRLFTKLVGIDLRDPRTTALRFQAIQEVPLLFCCQCPVAQQGMVYGLHLGFRLLSYPRGSRSTEFPYPGYPDMFAEVPAELSPALADDVTWTTRRPRLQVGGAPYVIDGQLRKIPCYECGAVMEFLASVIETGDPRLRFFDDYGVQIVYVYCAKCTVIACYSATT